MRVDDIRKIVEDDCVNSTECISHDVFFAGDVPNVSGELTDVVEITNCLRQSIVIGTSEGMSEGLLVGDDSEFPTFHLMTKEPDGFLYGQ